MGVDSNVGPHSKVKIMEETGGRFISGLNAPSTLCRFPTSISTIQTVVDSSLGTRINSTSDRNITYKGTLSDTVLKQRSHYSVNKLFSGEYINRSIIMIHHQVSAK
jgi:hypothetical protein